ncbi:MAG: 3'(2'),5'-bisphosphate nucleotidase CysQ [Saprospiraceae bacterium]|nr:3'(2'),5'-bisphosphate nucleotidase CysQ [Saprospiraceae bacterium]
MKDASEAILKIYRSSTYTTLTKTDETPVTDADILANDMITKFLNRKFPDIPVISEETELLPYEFRKKRDYVWLLDPLDGTKEFINQTDEFSINLALVYKGSPVAGFISLPVYSHLYYAIHGEGAYQLKDGYEVRLNASTFSLDQPLLKVVISRNHMDLQTKTYIDKLKDPELITLGSALKFTSIAKGEADYYPRMIHIKEWDTAAGQIIIEEAGGSLTDANTGLPLMYNKSSMVNPYFIACGKII